MHPFVTGDEMGKISSSPVRQKFWPTINFSVDAEYPWNVIYYKLLKPNDIRALKARILIKTRERYFAIRQCSSARRTIGKNILRTLKWNVLLHPPFWQNRNILLFPITTCFGLNVLMMFRRGTLTWSGTPSDKIFYVDSTMGKTRLRIS